MSLHTSADLAAETSWPDAVLGTGGIALVGTVVVVLLWHLLMAFRTWVSGKTAGGRNELAYRKLAEDTSRELHEINRRLAGTPEVTDGAGRRDNPTGELS